MNSGGRLWSQRVGGAQRQGVVSVHVAWSSITIISSCIHAFRPRLSIQTDARHIHVNQRCMRAEHTDTYMMLKAL